MAAKSSPLYIKGNRNTEVNTRQVTIGQIFQIECTDPSIVSKVSTLKLGKFSERQTDNTRSHRMVLSVIKVIGVIHKEYPQLEVQNMGETDFIVTYEVDNRKKEVLHRLKGLSICLLTFVGAAFSTMTFHNDVDITKLFSQIYVWMMGQPSDGCTILEGSYCIGITVGILLFFNHFGKKRFSVDPTPMEVEMRLYEQDIETTIVDTYERNGLE